MVLNQGWFWTPRGIWPCLEIIWVLIPWGSATTGILCVETEDAAESSTIHRVARTHSKGLSHSGCQQCWGGKPWLTVESEAFQIQEHTQFLISSPYFTFQIFCQKHGILFTENRVHTKHFPYQFLLKNLFNHSTKKCHVSTCCTFNFKLFQMWGVLWWTQQTRVTSLTGVEEIERDNIQVTQHV